MITERKQLLTSLLRLDGSLTEIARGLDALPFEGADGERVELTRSQAAAILARYLARELTAHRVTGWAKLIHGRLDVLFDEKDPEPVRRLIFELANPEINEALTPQFARVWIGKLGYQTPKGL